MTTSVRHSQLVRESQKRHKEKHLARKAVGKKVKRGLLPPAKTLKCFDCKKKADCYDHAKGYLGKNRFYVEAVCWSCHRKRGIKRKEYKNGAFYGWKKPRKISS